MNHKLIHLISSFKKGGRERQLSTIYKYSDNKKLDTKIICLNQSSDSYIEEFLTKDDIIFVKSRNPLSRILEIGRIIKENKADIIWSWGVLEATYISIISLTFKITHINGSLRYGIFRFNFHQIWRFIILHFSKNIVANSRAGLKVARVKKGKILYNGIDNDFFIKPKIDSAPIRGKLGIVESNILLTSIANLVPYKDYDTILKALSILKAKGMPFYFIAIGEGKGRKKITELCTELNIQDNVWFPGQRSDIKDILYASDIFIHSSLGEGCSNAILEAMSAGLPVIATDTGGTNEIIDDSVGRLFQFQNVDQLVKKIEELGGNKALRKTLGTNARIKAKSRFSVERMMSEYYSIVEEALK